MQKIEDNTQRFAERYIKRGAIVFDVGANVGQSAEVYSRLGARVICFEPNFYAAETLKSRGLPNVRVEPLALSDKDGSQIFYIDRRPEYLGMASSLIRLNDLRDESVEPVETTTLRLDEYVRRSRLVPGFVKVDVEGYEPQVLEGAGATIKKHRPPLVFEFWRTHWSRYVDTFAGLSTRYNLIDAETLTPILENFDPKGLAEMTNVLCAPRTRLEDARASWLGSRFASGWTTLISRLR